MTIFLPWTYVPLIMASNASYTSGCYVLSFDGMNWNDEPQCTIDPRTNQEMAVLSCNKFATFGVRCEAPPLFPNSTNTNNIQSINSTGTFTQNKLHSLIVGAGTSDAASYSCSILLLLVGLMLL